MMAAVDNPYTRPGGGGIDTLTDPLGSVALNVNSDADRRRAAITAAEHALVGGWTGDLGQVLDVLGLR